MQRTLTEREILQAVASGEAQGWEFKSAKGGVPRNMWETYSAMANTQSGVIMPGVQEQTETFNIVRVIDADRVQKKHLGQLE